MIVTLAIMFALVVQAPILAYRPVCSNYPPLRVYDWLDFGARGKDYSFLHGEPTDEFWELVAKYYTPFWRSGEFVLASPKQIGKKTRVSLRWLLYPFDEGRAGGEAEHNFVLASNTIAETIFERRKAAGRFENADMEPYMSRAVPGGMLTNPVLMLPYQCGFMEELVLKGGEFSGE